MAETDETVTLTRQQLYDRVWAEPVYKVAPRLHVSQAALVTACRRMQVPLPYLGYWQKLACGKEAERTELPEPDPDRPLEQQRTFARRQPVGRSRIKGTAAKLPPAPTVVVPKTLKSPHRLVAQAREYFSRMRPNSQGVLDQVARKAIALRVSPRSLDRGLRIYDALFRSMEDKGFHVSIPNWSQRVTVASLNGESVLFRIAEGLDLTRTPPRTLDGGAGERVHSPNGRLRLEMKSWTHGSKGVWRDAGGRSLESQLGEFLSVCLYAIEQSAIRTAEKHRQHQVLIREEERNQAIAARASEIMAQAKRSSDATLVRAYVDRVRAAMEGRGDAMGNAGVIRWLEWATAYADQLDPLAGGKPLPRIDNNPHGIDFTDGIRGT